MILQINNPIAAPIVTGEKISKQMGIANPAWIMEILSKKLYSRPIHTVIQEYLSNAYDANVKAGKPGAPVIMSLKQNDLEQWFVAFTDFGTGMQKDEVFETFCQYGASTKQNSENEIGMMGLGSKSAFSYVEDDMFFVKTVKDSVLSEYVIKKTGLGEQECFLTNSATSNLPNGTTVWFYLNENEKISNFVNAAKERASHIPNVVFDFSINLPQIKSNIIDYQTFQVNNIAKSFFNDTYVVLGKIPYKINWSEVGYEYRLCLPIGIKFSLSDGVYPTPNREELTYDKNSVKIIREKIKNCYNELIELLNSTIEVENWKKYILEKDEYYLSFENEKMCFSRNDINILTNITGSKILPKFCPTLQEIGEIHHIFNKQNILAGLTITHTLGAKSLKKNKKISNFFVENSIYFSQGEGKRKNNVTKYLTDKYFNTDVFLVSKKNFSFENFCSIFNLSSLYKDKNEEMYQKYMQFQLQYFQGLPKLEDVSLPDDFKVEKKVRVKRDKQENSLPVYTLVRGKNLQVACEKQNLSKILTEKDTVIFWCNKKDSIDVMKAKHLFNLLDGIKSTFNFKIILSFNDKITNKIKEHNCVHINDCVQCDFISRILSARLLYDNCCALENNIYVKQISIFYNFIPQKDWENFVANKNNVIHNFYVGHCRSFQLDLLKDKRFVIHQDVKDMLKKIENLTPLVEVLDMFEWYSSKKNEMIEIAKIYMKMKNIKFEF